MLIRSKLHRNGGSKVHFGSGKERREYHFLPLHPKAAHDDNRIDHVADVTNKEDLAKLLTIPEGYEIYDQDDAPVAQPAPRTTVTGDSHGSSGSDRAGVQLDKSVHDAIAAVDPTKAFIFVQDGDVVKVMPIDLGRTAPAADAKTSVKKAAKVPSEKDERAELVRQVTEKTGRKPHPSTSVKKLRETLAG